MTIAYTMKHRIVQSSCSKNSKQVRFMYHVQPEPEIYHFKLRKNQLHIQVNLKVFSKNVKLIWSWSEKFNHVEPTILRSCP